jgi:maltose O-acetyltransferase
MWYRLLKSDFAHRLLLKLPEGRSNGLLWRLRETSHTLRLRKRGRGGYLRDTTIACAGNVTVGDGVTCGGRVFIDGSAGVRIGDDVMIAHGVKITSAGHDPDVPRMNEGNLNRPVTIGRNVWLGIGAIILPGVSIADGVVVGAGAVVTRSIAKPNVIVAGIPARMLRDRRVSPNRMSSRLAA